MERTVPFNAFPTSNRGGGSGEESTGGGAMKRRSIDGSDGGGDPRVAAEEEKNKKPRSDGGKAEVTAEEEEEEEVNVAELGEDLVLEVLKRADARTLGRAACVSRRWRRLAEDERLWEAVCTRDWVRVPYGERQLRSVVLALGGFRRLHSLYILPFLGTSGPRTAASSPALALPSAAATSPSPITRRAHLQPRWGKDEVQLSLALLSIGFFEKMNPNNNHRGGGDGGCG
ncbi:F-box protein GID2-like isoform X1 [Musa acuminata AAA Group]|uniref:F-box protein GID2-like isoform X1 n=1 Tax=Musa acuminata AAA Group TaxID=214697 RepID=UPI0031D70FAF